VYRPGAANSPPPVALGAVEGVPPAASNGVPGDLTLETLWAVVQVMESRLRQLETRVRELEESGSEFRRALNRLGDALAATHDRPAMLSAVLDTCALYLRAPAGAFYGSVAGTERLRPLASCGTAPAPEDLTELKLGEGLAGAAAASGDVVIWPGSEVIAPSPDEPADEGARTGMAVPIRSGNRPFGVLAFYGRSADRSFTREDVDALVALVRQVETAIENTFLYEEATRLSITDGLTSLWNRRQFDLRVAAEHQRGVRFAEPFSIILLDLDQLKAVNDSLGHQAGDALLIEVAHRLASGVRDVDLVSRFGGDEFGLVLPSTGVAGALRVAEKVRGAIGGAPIDVGGRTPVRATVSVGVASYPEHGPTGRELVRAADAALYRAKAAGGNRVEHAKVEP
jgi:two-component system cell cycle response regulator